MKCIVCHKEIESDYLACFPPDVAKVLMDCDMHLSCMNSAARWFAKNQRYVDTVTAIEKRAYDRGVADGKEEAQLEAGWDE